MKRKKKIERTAKPFAARVWKAIGHISIDMKYALRFQKAYHYTVISCEYCKLVQSCDQIPTRSYVSCDEDSKCEDRKRVH